MFFVPVLFSSKGQKQTEQKVSILLVNKQAHIVSNALKIILQQIEPVSRSHKSVGIISGIYNQYNQLVSNEKEIVLNSSSPLATERSFQFIINLGTKAGNDSYYFLKIYDIEDLSKLNPIIEQRIENKSMYGNEF